MPIILALGFGLVAFFIYQSAQASNDGGSSDSGGVGSSPGGIVGPDGIPVSLPNTRGFRNNNPLNLRYIERNPFNGQVGNDGGYGIYDTLSNGVRAGGKELDNYVAEGVTTVANIITKWAPTNENDTASYIVAVADDMGVDTNQTLAWPSDKPDLVGAIIKHENGSNPLSISDITQYINS